MILVIGSTGMLGNEVCRQLILRNLSVRALVRKTSDPARQKELKDLGVQLKDGDLRDKSCFPGILEGITTVITTVSSMPFSYLSGQNDIRNVDEEGMINLIDAAKTEGIEHFIYTSFSKNLDLDFPLRNAKRKVEKYLQESGMRYTILRPSCFMEGWLSQTVGFDALNGKVNLFGNGNQPIAYISYKDVAKFAVECVSNPVATDTILELGGPASLSQNEVVKVFEDVLDKKIDVQYIPAEALQAQMDAATDPMQKSFSALMLCVANGDFISMHEILEKFPVKLTSVKEYASSVVQV